RIVLGEVAQGRMAAAAVARLEGAAEVMRPRSYVELLDALKGAAMLIANDGGPGHLAGIMGIPAVSIFGPTDPATWRPIGPRVAVVRGQPIEELAVERVHAAVNGLSK